MKKNTFKIVSLLLVIVMTMSLGVFGAGNTKTIKALIDGFSVTVDGAKLNMGSIYYNNILYVPVNVLGAALKTKINIDNRSKSLVIKSNEDQLSQLTNKNQELEAKLLDYDSLKAENGNLKSKYADYDSVKNENSSLKTKYADYDSIKQENASLKAKYADYDTIKQENTTLKTKYADYDTVKQENENLKAKYSDYDALKNDNEKLRADNKQLTSQITAVQPKENKPANSDASDVYTLGKANLLGNLNGNICSHGYASVQGDWIYYRNDAIFGNIYKIKSDGTGRTKLTDDNAYYINVIGNWIYYNSFTDASTGEIYKVRIDGTGKTKVIDGKARIVLVKDNYIYYTGSDKYLCRVKTDGTEKYSYGFLAENIAIDNDSLYYTDGFSIYRMNLDGSKKVKLASTYQTKFDASNTILYYLYNESNYGRLEPHGMRKVAFDNKPVEMDIDRDFEICVLGDYIYYTTLGKDTNYKYYIYRKRTDGSDKTLICSENVINMNVVGEWIYYICLDDQQQYKIKIDGTSKQLVEP